MKKSKIRNFFQIIYPYLCILLVTGAMLYPQIKNKVCLTGYDAWFHMNQFYDTAMQFKTGHFSYFISLFGFGGIGRIVNAIYGPGFVYLGGLILLLTRTWYHFEITQDILGLIFGGLFFYLLARKNYVTRLTSTLLSLMYMMSNMVMTWVINQEFNGIEAIFMPLILLQGTQMVRKRKISPITLGLTMAIVFQTHMMTTLMGTLTLIPFFLYAWYLTSKKLQLWKHLLMSIGLTALLTANVWGAMLNVIPQGLVPPVPQNILTPGGSVTFMMPGHYFSVLGFTYSVIVVFFISCGIISLLLWKRSNFLYKMILFIGLFIIWMSSAYFPWNFVLKIYPAFAYQIQFPKRFLSAGIILLFLAAGMLFSNHDVHLIDNRQSQFGKVAIVMIQIILVILVGLSYVYQRSLLSTSFAKYRNDHVIDYNPFYTYHPSHKMAKKIRFAYHSPKRLGRAIDLVHQDTPDYLPTDKVIYTYGQYRHAGLYSGIQRQIYGDMRYLRIRRSTAPNQLTMMWKQRHPARSPVLPIAKYQDTRIILNHHVLNNVRISRIGMAKVNCVPKGYNEVSINYQIPLWLHILMWITVFSWLGVILRLISLAYIKFGRYIPL